MSRNRHDLPLGILLPMLDEAFKDQLYDRLQKSGYEDLRPAYMTVFDVLNPTADRLVDLAEKAQTTKQAMSYLVAQLEEQDYLKRIPDPEDGRAQIILLTERGWQFLGHTRALIMQIQAEWAEKFDTGKMAQTIDLLRELAVSLGIEYVPPYLQNTNDSSL